ncbi:helix-hairpin-helix domain-containing protein [Undibacterium sp. FT147W]|uniref:Helix-hairpin-helix domain-containing protein n=1 Tax=Undibacterium rivi TaxID=2828729 RepID=A0ABS5H2M3_9BURK|nr:helix-hairpin-helix domain-containing protein [Undibacterium rivi]MBR7792935.1 helix-hairpin-helix domain-containing protein [Undibacterium rivi]
MFKKLLLAVAAMVATMGFAFADVDVNKGDQAALDGIKGIGPAKSKAIIEERTKNGSFKDWADFEARVKGIGDKNSTKLSEAGLTVNGQAKPGAPAKPAAADKSASKPAKAAKEPKESKADAKPADAPAKAAKADDKSTEKTPEKPVKASKAEKKAAKAEKADASEKAAASAKEGKAK